MFLYASDFNMIGFETAFLRVGGALLIFDKIYRYYKIVFIDFSCYLKVFYAILIWIIKSLSLVWLSWVTVYDF